MDLSTPSTSFAGDNGENGNIDQLPECPEGIYSMDQRAYRVYANAPISLFGILSNLLNIVVFMDYEMRQQLVNHFLLALSVSDLLLLLCNFFFLVLPVLVVEIDSFFWNDFFPHIIRYSYPLALTVQTSGVYLTVLVSVHRFLGVCHPFKAKRWVSQMAVEWAIAGSVLFSFAINIPTWLELAVTPCFSVRFNRNSSQIQLSSFHNMTYILLKKCVAYTILMFIVPFATLITVNCKMVCALRSSTRMRTRHTYSASSRGPNNDNIVRQLHLLKNTKYSEVFKTISKISYSSLLRPSSELFRPRCTNSTRDRSITLMLLAIVGLFLLCNGLAFLNSIVESIMLFNAHDDTEAIQETATEVLLNSTSDGKSDSWLDQEEDWMHRMVKWFECSVEVSNVLITLNSSTSTLIYLIFSSKYRMIFKAMFGLQKREKINRVALTTAMAARRVMELSMIPEEVENRSRSRRTTAAATREVTAISQAADDNEEGEGEEGEYCGQQRQYRRPPPALQRLPKMKSCYSGLHLSSLGTSTSLMTTSSSATSQRRALQKTLQKGSKDFFRSQGTLNRSLTNSESNLRLMDELETGCSPEISPAPRNDDGAGGGGERAQTFELVEVSTTAPAKDPFGHIL